MLRKKNLRKKLLTFVALVLIVAASLALIEFKLFSSPQECTCVSDSCLNAWNNVCLPLGELVWIDISCAICLSKDCFIVAELKCKYWDWEKGVYRYKYRPAHCTSKRCDDCKTFM